MFTVYILKDKNGKLYKGATSNLSRRMKEHKRGKTKTTFAMPEIELIYKEEYSSWEEARKREIYFKTAAGRRFIKRTISSVG